MEVIQRLSIQTLSIEDEIRRAVSTINGEDDGEIVATRENYQAFMGLIEAKINELLMQSGRSFAQ